MVDGSQSRQILIIKKNNIDLLMSHIPIDFGRPFDIELFPVSWSDNAGVFRIVGMRCPHQRYLRGGKRYPLLLFYQENVPCS